MGRVGKIAFVLLLLSGCFRAGAQVGEVSLSGQVGHNATLGVFSGAKLSAAYRTSSWFQVRGAFRGISFPEYTVDLRPGLYHDFPFGTVSAEILAQCSYLNTTFEVCAGVGFGFSMKWVWVSAGYYCRHLLPATGDKGLCEPVNVMYELGVSCLPDEDAWDLYVTLSNCRLAQLEKFYMPSLAVQCVFYPISDLGVTASVEYGRAGVFNVSSDHHQGLMSLGVQYRW